MSEIAEHARALELRLLGRRWDDPALTPATIDAALTELESLQSDSNDADDARAIRDAVDAVARLRGVGQREARPGAETLR